MSTTATPPLSVADLTRAYLGEAMSMPALFDRLAALELDSEPNVRETLWVGSVGYERHKQNEDFARLLRNAGVERLVDVRELPISRRRGYAKTALSEAMATVGIEYVHIRALGNPKPFRDLYKAGRTSEGRAHYERHLLSRRRGALVELVPLLREKRTALMCLEHDPATCHRTVILDALRDELGVELDVAELA